MGGDIPCYIAEKIKENPRKNIVIQNYGFIGPFGILYIRYNYWVSILLTYVLSFYGSYNNCFIATTLNKK